ncbi:hypothetical protein EPO04_00720 [Patescibacteria group bacterium]|nr:MAG: hypothetical protein EPO04_00720 [Patescibacteria group bacterium]
MAAPLALMSLKSTLVKDTDAALTVAAEPSDKDVASTLLVTLLPVIVKVPVTIEDPPLNWMVSVFAAVPVRVRFLHVKVFATIATPEPAITIDPPLVLKPEPPNQVEVAPFRVTVDVLVVTVRLVNVLVSQAVPVEVSVMAELPIVNVRALLLEDISLPQLQVWPFAFRVPVVSVTAPTTVEPALCSKVRSDLFIVMVLALAVAPVIVTVAAVPELLSKVTSSEDVGTDAPLEPPVVADQ